MVEGQGGTHFPVEAVWRENRKLREEFEVLQRGFETVTKTESLLREVWKNNPVAIFVETLEGEIINCNPAACQMFGYSQDELLGLNVSELVSEDSPTVFQGVGEVRETAENVCMDLMTLRRDGTVFPTRVNTCILEVEGEHLRIAYVRDISDLKKKEEVLRFQAYTDGLTGIWNRSFFQRRLLEEMGRVRRYGSVLSLVMFDLDRFKHFNDKYGHVRGDKALKGIADLVRKSIRVSDCFSRWGGDEFLIFSPVSGEKAVAFAERLRRKIKETDWSQGVEVTLSLGVVEYQGGISLELLVDRADKAMYMAKRAGGDRVCAWNGESGPDGRGSGRCGLSDNQSG